MFDSWLRHPPQGCRRDEKYVEETKNMKNWNPGPVWRIEIPIKRIWAWSTRQDPDPLGGTPRVKGMESDDTPVTQRSYQHPEGKKEEENMGVSGFKNQK